jgi:hypothetical protein
MLHRIPRLFRRSFLLGALVLMGVLVSAPAAGAIPIGDPSLPPPPSPSTHLPDLVVETGGWLGYPDTGYAGPYLGYYNKVRIRNQSNHDIFGSFYVRDDSSWNKTVKVNGLAAGSHADVYFYRYTCETRGTVKVDAFNQIPESNENNNSRWWLTVC